MTKMLEKIKQVAQNHPNKIAYKVGNKSITYNELISLAQDYATLLARQGCEPVIIYGHKEIYVIISILACLMANRAYVPVDFSTPLQRLIKIAILSKSSLIITESNINIKEIKCSNLEQLKDYENCEIKKCSTDIAYIIFTSGSTGEPKGVPISRTNLNNFINWISNFAPLNTYKNAIVLNQASFSFDLSVADLYYSLCNAHTLIAFSGDLGRDYNELFALFKDEKINIAVMTPTLMKSCLLNSEFNEKNYPEFKCVYFCGEILENKTAKKLFEKFTNLKIINAYGPSEATSAVCGILITKEMIENEIPLPVGDMKKTATNIEIIENEIVLKGKSVFGGYLGIKGGFYKENNQNCYKTGDIGYIKDEKLYCKGRIDTQIKYKGYRIELFDIEYNLTQIMGVKEAVVITKKDENGAIKTIKAFVLANIDEEQIKARLVQKIPAYMLPKTIKIMDKFPLNQNGKTDRKALSKL